MRIAIIDDQLDGRQVLESLLMAKEGLTVVGSAANVDSAYNLIVRTTPDLVFLDANLPLGSGFDLLQRFQDAHFKIIFMTVYDQQIIKALKYSEFDYLLKPINPKELEIILEKVRINGLKGRETPHLDNIKPNVSRSKIAIPSVSSIQYVEIDQIIRFEAQGNYTDIYLTNGIKITSTKLLKDFEGIVHDMGFFRIHRSHCIHLKYVDLFSNKGGDHAILSDGSKVFISRNRKPLFLEAMTKV